MFFNNVRRRVFKIRARRNLVLFFAAFFTLSIFSAAPTAANEQTVLTRRQFLRLNVLTRASFFEREILKAANEEGADPNILWAIAYLETRFRPWLTSPKDARGLMQFIPSTARRFDLTDAYQPAQAIRAAAKYVKILSNLFGGRIDSILAAYNSGEGTVAAYGSGRPLRDGRRIINAGEQKTIGGVPPYAETVGYVGRGLKIYRWLVARGTFPNASLKANFPAAISASVARVSLVDAELGQVPNFVVSTALQTIPNQTTAVQNQPQNQPNEQPTKNSKTQEIYYDARSGSRYITSENGPVKLPEDGVVVVSQDTRQPNAKARSTFFATPIKK